MYIDETIQYNLSDFDDVPEVEEFTKTKVQVAVDMNGLLLDPAANPPIHKLEALMEADNKFDQSCEHRRKDFPSGDYSQSSYDQSLASMAALAEWSLCSAFVAAIIDQLSSYPCDEPAPAF